MSDIQGKAEALAKRALQRSAIEKQAAADKRAETWAKIQQTNTEIAKFLADISREFGKPSAIMVELGGETVIDQGTFAKPRRYYNGKIRDWHQK